MENAQHGLTLLASRVSEEKMAVIQMKKSQIVTESGKNSKSFLFQKFYAFFIKAFFIKFYAFRDLRVFHQVLRVSREFVDLDDLQGH